MMTTCRKNRTDKDQQGWILIIGLVMLVMLTVIAMGLMRTTRMEEKMAGVTRDMYLSFEASEIALRAGESFIETLPSSSVFNSTGAGLYAQGDDPRDQEPSPFSTEWTNANSKQLPGSARFVKETPRYMIKKVGEIGSNGSLNMGGYGETDLSQKSVIYRITARGIGGNQNTRTVLRSHFAKAD